MAIDVERLQLITPQIQQYWSSPFQIVLALILLFDTLGVAALSGVFIMAMFVPLTVFGSVFSRNWQVGMEETKTNMELTQINFRQNR